MPLPGGRDVAAAAGVGALALLGGAVATSFQRAGGPDMGTAALTIAAAAAWSWHRAAPIASSSAVVAVVVVHLLTGGPYGPIQITVVLACFTVARHRGAWVAAWVCGAEALALAAALWTRLDSSHVEATVAILVAWPGVFAVVPALVGALVRVRAESAARERAELLARGAYEERLRVAREVHDIAGHGFAVVAMQAGIALSVLDDDPGQVRVSLEAVRASSERALRELRSALEGMQTGAPTTHDVPELVERVRACGQPVELTVTGRPGGVGAEIGRVVYRIVQEALTNVMRHAGPVPAEVAIEYGAREIAVTVRDRGADGALGPVPGAGSRAAGGCGLRGLRERVEGVGGSFAAVGRDTGGFELSATLPRAGAAR